MDKNIHFEIPPERLWDFYILNKPKLCESQARIAYNNETGYDIYLTTNKYDDAVIIAYRGDNVEYECFATSAKDLEYVLENCVASYQWLLENVIENEENDEDEVYEREDDLEQGMLDFLEEALCAGRAQIMEEYGQDLVQSCVDQMCMYLATEHGISVYRPIQDDDGNGKRCTIEYPYSDLIGN